MFGTSLTLSTPPPTPLVAPPMPGIRTFKIFSDEQPATLPACPPPSARTPTPTPDAPLVNKENIPPRWCSAPPSSSVGGKKKKGITSSVVHQGGISKARAPLAPKAVTRKHKLAKDPALERVKELAEAQRRLGEEVEWNMFNHLAKELTELPLGDLSAAYGVQGVAED